MTIYLFLFLMYVMYYAEGKPKRYNILSGYFLNFVFCIDQQNILPMLIFLMHSYGQPNCRHSSSVRRNRYR